MATGAVANNFHEGGRSEYLAQYIFTAFGTSNPVLRQEDYGIDLNCTLGELKDKNLLYVDNYYYVQVKSNTNDIDYDSPDSLKWWSSFKYPILFCVIDKKTSRTKIYHTINVYKHLMENKTQFNIVFDEKNKDIKNVWIGEAIIDFKIGEIAIAEKRQRFKEILKTWLNILQRTIDYRSLGINVGFEYKDYKKNNDPHGNGVTLNANFKEFEDDIKKNRYYEILVFLLANEIHKIVSNNDKDTFLNVLPIFMGIIDKQIIEQFSFHYYKIAIESGAKKLKLEKEVSNILSGFPLNFDSIDILS